MRTYHHTIEKSKSKKSINLQVYVDDVFGKKKIKYASVSGWRAKIAEKHLILNKDDWDDDVARKFVGMMVLKSAQNEYQGIQFLNHIKSESSLEIHFWSYQFLTNKKAPNAWKILNSDVA